MERRKRTRMLLVVGLTVVVGILIWILVRALFFGGSSESEEARVQAVMDETGEAMEQELGYARACDKGGGTACVSLAKLYAGSSGNLPKDEGDVLRLIVKGCELGNEEGCAAAPFALYRVATELGTAACAGIVFSREEAIQVADAPECSASFSSGGMKCAEEGGRELTECRQMLALHGEASRELLAKGAAQAGTRCMGGDRQACWNIMEFSEYDWVPNAALKTAIEGIPEDVLKLGAELRPDRQMQAIYDAVVKYHTQHCALPEPAPMTVDPTACCKAPLDGDGDHRCDAHADYGAHRTWKTLGIEFVGPQDFGFALETGGYPYPFKVVAKGDLDCDGKQSLFELAPMNGQREKCQPFPAKGGMYTVGASN